MKTKFLLLSAFLAAGLSAQAAVLSSATAVHAEPQDNAPVLSYLKAGATITPASQGAPTGWLAVELREPVEAYIAKKDFNKSLDVAPGSEVHSQAKPESPVLFKTDPSDKLEITGVRGRWMQVRIKKAVTGFIHSSAAPAAAPVVNNAASTAPASKPVPAPVASAPKPAPAPVAQAPAAAPIPSTPSLNTAAAAGRAVAQGEGDNSSALLPRSYQGKFVSTRRPFAPRRPFDYQVNDESGVRFAYLDLSKLMLTDSLEKYQDRDVIVYGVAKNTNEGKDIVIEVESLQLK